ncbi:MAG: hypothetical protein CMM01_07390 [Rhodopirellula sp.]|nr:hypothetical protein [Rhodopirellula sp.]
MCGLNWTPVAQKSDAHVLGMMDTDTEITLSVRAELSDERDLSRINDLAKYPTGKVPGVAFRPI